MLSHDEKQPLSRESLAERLQRALDILYSGRVGLAREELEKLLADIKRAK